MSTFTRYINPPLLSSCLVKLIELMSRKLKGESGYGVGCWVGD